MGNLKWQQVALILSLILVSAGGITYTDLFGSLFELKGINATWSGDLTCYGQDMDGDGELNSIIDNIPEECASYLNITTTYWRICFSHYNNSKYENETLFKKQSRSRTLHVNLDNVNNIISTNPEVRVDWLVPTYGKKWRPLKDGDCWERGKINKIKLVGHKDPFQDVKWSFKMEGEANISIDPMWKGIKSFTETDKWKVNFYTEPDLTKTCFKISIENKQDINDNFPFQSILNQTSVDINKVSVTLKERKKEDYFVTICNICEINQTINQTNNLTESECLENNSCFWENSTCVCEINQTLNITSCSECGSYEEERERWVWKDRNLIKEEKEGDKEIRNQFEEVTVQKAGKPYNPVWFELCYEFNEVPIREDGNWGSSGFMYLNSSTGVYFDFENSSWWNVSFDKKREINCSNMETDQPFVINGSSGFSIGGENQIVWTVCKGTGTALYYNNYTDYVVANDTEQLPFEVERGNGTSYNPTSVWDSNYEGVWHLPESSGDAIDSTNVLNATYKGDLPTPVDGKIGKAQSLDGTGDYAEKTTSELKNQNFTLEAWAKTSFTNPDLWAAFVSYHNLNDYYGYIFRIAPEGWGFHRETCISLVSNSGSILAGTDIVRGTSITDDTWHYVVATNDGTTLKVYVDGASPHTGTSGTSIWDTTMYLDIGATYGDGTGSSDYPGLLDEVRVSDSCRSDDWINASYKNAIGTAGYGMLGSEEEVEDTISPTYSDNSTNTTLAGASTLFSLRWDDMKNATATGNLTGGKYVFSIYNGSNTTYCDGSADSCDTWTNSTTCGWDSGCTWTGLTWYIRTDDDGTSDASGLETPTFANMPNTSYSALATALTDDDTVYSMKVVSKAVGNISWWMEDDTGGDEVTNYMYGAFQHGHVTSDSKHIECGSEVASASSFGVTFDTSFPNTSYSAICNPLTDTDSPICIQDDVIGKAVGGLTFRLNDDIGNNEIVSGIDWCVFQHGEYDIGEVSVKAGSEDVTNGAMSVTLTTEFSDTSYVVFITDATSYISDGCACEVTERLVGSFTAFCEDDGGSSANCDEIFDWVAIEKGDFNTSYNNCLGATDDCGTYNSSQTNCERVACDWNSVEFSSDSAVTFNSSHCINDSTCWSNVTKMVNSTVGSTIKWKVEAEDEWGNSNTSAEYSYTTIAGADTTSPTYSDNQTNTTIVGASTLFSLKWEDETELSGYIFSFCNGTWNGSACVGGSSSYTTTQAQALLDDYVWTPYCQYLKFNFSNVDSRPTNANFSFFGVQTNAEIPNISMRRITSFWDGSESAAELNALSTSGEWNRTYSLTLNIWQNLSITELVQECWDNDQKDNCSIKILGAGQSCGINGKGSGAFIKFGDGDGADYYNSRDNSNSTHYWRVYLDYSGSDWVNDSWVAMGGVLNWSNVTKSVNSTVGANISWIVYANDTSDNWNTSGTYSYTTTSAPSDTCTCAGLDTNWEIDLSDNCNITSNCNLGTGNVTFINSGGCWCNATINCSGLSPPPNSSGTLWIQSDCIINIS